jgi:hypothetical protein
MSNIVNLADSVVLFINAEKSQLGISVDVVRSYLPRYDLKDMDTLHITVVTKANAVQEIGRKTRQYDPQIDIAVQKRFSEATKTEEIDALMDIVEAIIDLFCGCQIGDFNAIAVVNDPIYSPDHMAQYNQFTSVITVHFRVCV